MRRKSITLTYLGIALLLCACKAKTMGERVYFARQFPPEIGVLSITEATKKYGAPDKSTTIVESQKQSEIYRWSYAQLDSSYPLFQRLSIEFNLKTGMADGYMFISTFSDYRGNYDFSKKEKLKIGITKLGEVYDLFGYPSGRFSVSSEMRPKDLVSPKDYADDAIILAFESGKQYWNGHTWGNAEFLIIVLQNGVVKDMKYRKESDRLREK